MTVGVRYLPNVAGPLRDKVRELERERVTVQEAARQLGITESAVRKRAQRGQVRSEKAMEGKKERLYIFLDPDEDKFPEPFRERYIRSLEQRVSTLEDEVYRQQAILLNMTEAMKALSPPAQEEPSEARESPQAAEEEPDPRLGTEGAQEATEQVAARPVERLPLAWWILWGAQSVVAYPLAVYLQIALQDWFPLLLLVIPGVFGYMVGVKLRKLSFWRHIVPIGVLLIAGGLIGFGLSSYITPWWIVPRFSFNSFLWVFSSAALYSFAALLGNARRRWQIANLIGDGPSGAADSDVPAQGWTPRQQALVALIGTAISAITALVGLIGTIINVTHGNGGGG